MIRKVYFTLAAMLLMPMGILGQTYQQLWKQVQEAQEKDLPQTAIQQLERIEKKAQKESAYGQLLKSTLLHARLQAKVSADSLRSSVSRLEQKTEGLNDEALKAVYYTVLSKVYQNNSGFFDDADTKSQSYQEKALAHPTILAGKHAADYEPFVISGKDSKTYFNDDLLSVIGNELDAWRCLHDYYTAAGNRSAACLTGANAFDTTAQLDSLAEVYGDLPEACEIAIKRYGLMHQDDDATKIAYVRQSLAKWGSWKRANWFKNEERELTTPTFSAQLSKQLAMPQEPLTIQLELHNVQSLTMQVYRTPLKGDTELNANNDYKQLKSQLQIRSDLTRTLQFHGHADYEYFKDSIQLAGLEPGVYLIEFTSPQTNPSRQLYFVSGLRVLSQPMPQNKVRYVVVDARSGQPVANATLRMAYNTGWKKPKKIEEHTCNSQGELLKDMGDRTPSEIYAVTKTDCYSPSANAYGRFGYYEQSYNREHLNLFTDRSIYRPGQAVSVTAIVWKDLSAIDNEAVSGKKVTFALRDANDKLVAEQQATTDSYGKCATQFTLPTNLLNGRFTIRAANSSCSFSVEEYKRPTFQVEFPEYKESYKAGDTVRVQAKAMTYAGVPVQGAQVKYTVKRRVAYWWLSYSWYWEGGYFGRGLQEEVLSEGEATTGDDGTFDVAMPMRLPDDIGSARMYYHFVVDADVTDTAGETHSGTLSLPLGTKPTALTCNMPQQVRSDQMPQVTFTRCNAAGKEIAGTVRYRIDNGKWLECAANYQLSIINYQLKSGEHRLEAVCEADTINMTFVVFGLDDKRPATTTHDWFYVSHTQFPNDGTPVTLQVGSSDPNLHIVYGIYASDKVIESGVVKKSGELLNRKFTYKEEYGNGLLVTYAWVKDGVCYTHQQTIKRPTPDKQLRLSWETFRDRLTPGQQEEWRLKVLNPDGTPANASLMAVLYDKSLDQLKPHQWTFSPTPYMPLPSTSWYFCHAGSLAWRGYQSNQTYLTIPTMAYSHFDDSVLPYFVPRRLYNVHVRGMRTLAKSAAVMEETAIGAFDVVGNDMAAGEVLKAKEVVVARTDAKAAMVADEATEEKQGEQEVQLRENLQETAFCYPTLTTDEKGQVVVKFTLPESLTTWRFMGIANTAQMLYGSIGGEAVAKKDVMIQPNVPRFVRMGDEAQISARIFNTSEKAVSGTSKLQLIDPETNNVVMSQEQPFAVEADKTGTVTFQVSCSKFQVSLLICKVTAAGDGFSDGEQHYLPILPDREHVTKTVPYTQHEPGVKTIDLTALFPQGTTQQKMTVEYTNNPAWLMVQALPVIGEPWEHSAIDQAASYYSNMLAKTLLAQSPQVKGVFEQWKREMLEVDATAVANSSLFTLHSSLKKNQELKDLVLAETPWVQDADRETEQKQRLADFFDENGINNRLATAVEKLRKLQNSDGSFSWYPGMSGCTYITVAIEEMLVRLNVMTGQQNDTRQMQDKAFNYIGEEMADLVKELKKQEKKGHKPSFPSFTALRWLYLCALDGRQLAPNVQSANDYLIKLLKKDIKQQTIYEKALTAVVLAKHGETKKAAEYVQSLKEYTVYTEEMGRYYDTRRASYSWYDYKIPTEVAAIEAIQMVTPNDQQTVDEMRRWLLQEKRTQAWNTAINSTNAIYAFLNGSSQLTTDYTPTVLAIDGTAIETSKATAGIGYVKTAITEPQGKTFTATKTSEGTSWGAVYAQFLQKTSDIEASQSGITVKRELLLNHNGQWSTVNGQCAVGDRIKIRLTIETSRDLDFVQVTDRRAACMEPVKQLSGYQHGAYVSPKDFATNYYYYGLAKGKHVIETEYYIDRAGQYETGTCSVQCAYAPEYRATAPSMVLKVKGKK